MAENIIKARLADGQPTIGAWLTVNSEQVADALASIGFDWVVVDFEHGSADVADAANAFIAIERHGAAPLARLPGHDPALGRRMLDLGAHGLIVPVVEDAGEFRRLIDHFLYPPRGRRGVGLGRFNRWGDDFDDYLTNFEPLLVPMIETRKGVAAADAIAAIAETDAIFLGPYDLSSDLGAPGDFECDAFKAAIGEVRQACDRHDKALGIHQVATEQAELRKRLDEGFRFIAYGTDMIALRTALAAARPLIDQLK